MGQPLKAKKDKEGSAAGLGEYRSLDQGTSQGFNRLMKVVC